MIIDRFDKNKKDNTPIALALGFFDSLHKGHAAVIGGAKQFAAANNCISAVFTFDNNPFAAMGKDVKLVYTFSERCELLKHMGVDLVVAADFNAALINVNASDFLETLINRFNIKYISCGPDYAFGKNAEGKTALLAEFCRIHNISLEIVPEAERNKEKISSGKIRELIAAGDIETANGLLNAPFCVFGVVTQGRGAGGKLTYPTANIIPPCDKVVLGEGVYATNAYIGGKKYMSVTNAGAKPTFKDDSYGIETYILDFNEHNNSLYGQYIKVEFIKKIRKVFSFSSIYRLKQQISADIESRRAILL